MTSFPAMHGCKLEIVGAGGGHGCAPNWRGWIVGTCELLPGPTQHLALQGAPRIIANPARAIDGPGMVPGSRVDSRGEARAGGKLMHWYFVPPATNEGSLFGGHLVLVWNSEGHTYAYGFHVLQTIAVARAMDLELVRHLIIVKPRSGS